jgi:O-antigen ligase
LFPATAFLFSNLRTPASGSETQPSAVQGPPLPLNNGSFLSRGGEVVCGLLLAISFAGIQVLTGGTRPVFSLPAYGLLAVMALLSIFSLRRAKPSPDNICLISVVIFFGYIIVRAFLSTDEYLARADIYLVLASLLVYFFVACVFTEAKRRLWIVCVLIVLAMVDVGIGAIQFRDGSNVMLIPFLQRFDYGRRASGLYVNPNHLAGVLEIVGIFALSLSCWSRWPTWAKLLGLYAAVVCYVGIILTGRRGGYFSAGASLFVLASLSLIVLWRAGKGIFARIGGATLVVAALIALVVFFFVRQSFFVADRTSTGLEGEVYNRRYDMWHAALEQWRLQPIIGTGAGTYLYYGRQFRAESTNKDPVYAHNDYVQLLAEYGLVGSAAFLVFFGAHLFRGWRNFQRLGPKRVIVSTRLFSNALALQIAALSAIAAYIVHSIVDFNLHIPANALLIAFVFGILANPGVFRGEQQPTSAPGTLIAWRVLLIALGIFVGVQCFRFLPAEYLSERARTALRDGDPKTSAGYAVRALAIEQKNPNIYYYLGRAGILEGNEATDTNKRAFFFQVATVAFEKGRALVPRDETFPLELASVYDALQRFGEAEWMYDEAFRLDPRSVEIHRAYDAHLERWRKSSEALSKPTQE